MSKRRRTFLATAAALGSLARHAVATEAAHPDPAWYREAERMRELARSWGDQDYGAVVVQGRRVIGFGPSRVVKDGDPDAPAERVAIREALAASRGGSLSGAVLYSTSRPCAACEAAAAQAGITRRYFGPRLQDAGASVMSGR